ncbi:isochorismatase family protein [Arcanobacterium hippocoleae]|uniref:nicotinamidase n=1 Tax=Arcanobacterium hippocoleae TaxID=149017 RepID=A0ABU1T398_9ACTO|nr:isochorismatase family protein [Arcanobacterium hippocoleae]MDR6939839.1 nicotinamidase/pyrazinamidase [Arcanobacterium hippocoleae]
MNQEKRALLIVDVQPTFCEGGALPIIGGNDVARKIADFVTENASEYELIVTTQDWHIDPGTHFSENPDFIDTWPPHGVAGTPEADLHEEIAALAFDDAVKKGEYTAAYSGFEGKNESGDTLEEILRTHEIQAIDIAGLAESHCVKDTALDALRLGWPVRVFSDLTAPVSAELGVAARAEMDEAGIEQLSTADAFGFYEEGEDTPIPGDDIAGSSAGFTFGSVDSWSDDTDDSWDDFSNDDSEDFSNDPDHRWNDADTWNADDAVWDDLDTDWEQDPLYDPDRENFAEAEADPSVASVAAEIAAAVGRQPMQSTSLQKEPQLTESAAVSWPGMPAEDLSALDDFADADFDLTDFDLDFDQQIDFSAEVSDDDFDFSNIDFRPGQ